VPQLINRCAILLAAVLAPLLLQWQPLSPRKDADHIFLMLMAALGNSVSPSARISASSHKLGVK
jgi:hypothetical protein